MMRRRDAGWSPVVRRLVAIGILLSATSATAQASELSIAVSPDQRVSVSGRSASLRTVVEDVCYRAGIDVRSYDAEDRAFGGTYADLTAKSFLERLLRRESFMMEVASVDDAQRVVAIRVLGNPTAAAARRARGQAPRRSGFQVPPALVRTAFRATDGDQAGREAALGVIGSRIAGDPAQLEAFLTTDPLQIALAVQRHRGAESALRELQLRYPEPRIARKIDEIVAALRSLR